MYLTESQRLLLAELTVSHLPAPTTYELMSQLHSGPPTCPSVWLSLCRAEGNVSLFLDTVII